jgi:hypothetical protein
MYKFINLVLIISLIIASNSALADASNPVQAKATLRTPLQYIGWAVLKRNIIDPSAKEDEWISMRNISVTDDGKRIRLMDGEKETPKHWGASATANGRQKEHGVEGIMVGATGGQVKRVDRQNRWVDQTYGAPA